MRWTLDNKVAQVTKGNRYIRYWYDASGNRVMKRLHGDTVDYILRDASGTELQRIVRRQNSGASPILLSRESSLYGSSRLGTYAFSPNPGNDSTERRTNAKTTYELTDHLGNIRATVSDQKTYTAITGGYSLAANVLSANDYFPFGLPSRTFQLGYKWGFNGKENDQELLSGGRMQDYGFRGYRPDLGRFFAVDPLTKDYPYYTPYQFAGNEVVRYIDLDGLEPSALYVLWESVGKTKLAAKQLIKKVENTTKEILSTFDSGNCGEQKAGKVLTNENGRGPDEAKQKATESKEEDLEIGLLLQVLSALMPWDKTDLKPPALKDPEKAPEVVDKLKSVVEKTKEVSVPEKPNKEPEPAKKPVRQGSAQSYDSDGKYNGDSASYIFPDGHTEKYFEPIKK